MTATLNIFWIILHERNYILFSLFRMPKVVCERLERIQREFLWGRGNLEKKPHLFNWKTVCTEKKKGGLGGEKSLSIE